MKNLRIVNYILLVTIILLGLLAGSMSGKSELAHAGTPTPATETVILKAVSFAPPTEADSKALARFVDTVNKHPKLQGKLGIKYVGGPEVIPPFELIDAVRKGVVDIAMEPAGYYAGSEPICNYFELSPYSASEERKKGVYDYINKIHQEKLGIAYLARPNSEPTFQVYVNKRINRIDEFKGLKMRTSPTYMAFLNALGCALVRMPMGEIYTAMDRGTVDGYATPMYNLTSYGLHEVTKYCIDHNFYRLEVFLIANLNSWNRLSKDVQDTVIGICNELEGWGATYFMEVEQANRQICKKAGMEFIKLPPDDAKRFVALAYEADWKEAFEKAPTEAAQLRKLYGLPPWTGR
jgi:TRAP-type C4-dicarboxylate transport system substrate-binding protein